MHGVSRREFGAVLAAFAALGAGVSEAQENEPTLSKSEVYQYSKLPVKVSANGTEGRAGVHGNLPTGEFIEVHETTLAPGQMPHPPHRHRHTEMLLIRSGTLETTNDGVPQRAGPGDVVFTGSGVLHGLKNVGTTPAMYFVVAIGQQMAEG